MVHLHECRQRPGSAQASIAIATLLLALTFSACRVAAAACVPGPAAAGCIQAALNRLPPGGGKVTLEAGTYELTAPIQFTRDGAVLEGVGDATVLLRRATVVDGEGVLNLRGSGQRLLNLKVDGNIVEPVRIPYADPSGGMSVFGAPIYANPMHPEFLRDSSIVIHRGASGVVIEGVTVEHTGGFAVLVDARYGDIRNVVIRGSTFRNNRPHLFGKPGDLSYGAWTGGIHYQNDGRDLDFARYALREFTVENCVFERIAGHAIWGHGYGFQTLNENIRIQDNRFTDIGLDAVLIGNAVNAVVADNEMRRIGFVATSADDRPIPAWYPGARADMADNIPAVGIDSTGLVRQSSYRGNRMLSVNGTALDLDGFTRGEILDNIVHIPGRENAFAAATDQVSLFGPGGVGNVSKGINLSNTSGVEPIQEVHIAGNTLINLRGYAMLLVDCQDSLVEDNIIRHYSLTYPPIVLANSLREPRRIHSSHGNVVRKNTIYFPWQAHCIAEADNIGGGELPVAGPNFVYGNVCASEWGEFGPAKQSGSRNTAPPSGSAP